MLHRHLARVRRAVVLCALLGAAAAAPAAHAATVEVDGSNATPTETNIALAAGEQLRLEVTSDSIDCDTESQYPCYVDANGSETCSDIGGLDCVAPSLPAFSIIGRVNRRPWKFVGVGPTYLTGPGVVQLIYNTDYSQNISAGIDEVFMTLIPAGDTRINSITSTPVTVGPSAQAIALVNLPAIEPLGTDSAKTLAAAPLRSSPLRSSPLRSSPLRSSPLRSSPLRSSPLRSSPLTSIPLRSSSWDEVLAGSSLSAPPSALTLDQVFALDPVPAKLNALTLADIDLEHSPLRSSSLTAVLFGLVPLSKLEPPVGWDWCSLVGQPADCNLSTKNLLDVDNYGYGIDLSQTKLNGPGIDISGSPLATIHISDLVLSRTKLAGRTDLRSYETVGDLVRALPLPNLEVLTIGDLLPGIVATGDLPVEETPIDDLTAVGYKDPANRLSYTVLTSVRCYSGTFTLDVTLPSGAKLVPGSISARLTDTTFPLSDPVNGTDERFTINASDALDYSICGDSDTDYPVSVTFQIDPPSRLGLPTVEVVAHGDGTDQTAAAGTSSRVEDVDDPGDTPATAGEIASSSLTTGYIATDDDLDVYKLQAPPVGSTVTITLSHLPADYDLTVTGPQTGISAAPLRSSPLRSSPLRSSTIGDERIGASDNVTPALLQDAPLRSSELVGSPLRSSSINRGLSTESASFTVTPDDAGKFFYVHVSGYNGASSDDPYVLRTQVQAAPEQPQCRDARSLNGSAARGTFPTLPLAASTKTLFLVDERRLAQLYPGASISALRAKLDAIAARPEVAGVVIPVESDPQRPTDAAFAAWDANPCSESAANDVVSAIRGVIGHVSPNLDQLRNIVLVGGDEVLPQARVKDYVSVSNESEEAGAVAFGGKDTAISRSLRDGYLLTDDAYGDFATHTGLGGQTFVPDVALGRLVETPDEIGAQLDQYGAADGALTVGTAQVAGYDFLTDGAQAIVSQLRNLRGTQVSDDLISENWTAAQAATALNRSGGGITSINGHYDHYRALPAAAFNGLVPNLLSSLQVNPAANSLIFTAGCHAGLNVPDVGAPDAGSADSARLLDWPQDMAESRSVYIANTTFGYGDTEAVAYTERLLELLANGIASQQVTAGQALMLAKQRYAAEQQTPGVYDQKASMGLTYYGLPFFTIGATGQEGAPTLPKSPSGSPSTSTGASFDVDPTFAQKTTPAGNYYTADGQAPQITHYRPVEPRVTVDVTPTDGQDVHGALITELTQRSSFYDNPLISQPVIDAGDDPDPSRFRDTFPTSLTRTTQTGSAAGVRDQLVLAVGQYLGNAYQQRLFTHVGGTILRSGSADFDPPTMTDVRGTLENVSGGNATFSIRVRATSNDVVRGVAMVHARFYDDDRPWQAVTLARDGDFWAGSVTVEDSDYPEFFVQLVDAAGNVGVSTNKGPGYYPVPASVGDTASLSVSPRRPASGIYDGPVTVTIDNRRPGVSYQVSVDQAAPINYNEPIQVTGGGRHTVRFLGSDSSEDGVLFDIAGGTPTPTPTPTRTPTPTPVPTRTPTPTPVPTRTPTPTPVPTRTPTPTPTRTPTPTPVPTRTPTPTPRPTPTPTPSPAKLTSTTSTLAFGEVWFDAPKSLTFKVTNSGQTALTGLTAKLTGTYAGQFKVAGAPASLAGGASATLTVTFTPAVRGAITATLALASTNGGSKAIALTATGRSPIATLSATSLAFGNVTRGKSLAKTIKVTNTGDGNLTFTNYPVISGPDAARFTWSGSKAALANGRSTTFTVTFKPTVTGARTATLKFSPRSTAVALTGTGK